MKRYVWRTLLVVLALEGALQILCWTFDPVNTLLSPRVRTTDVNPRRKDGHLINRGNPHYSGHDHRGWRNVGRQEHFDIVAVGNSQTYGMGVALQHAWPQQLEFLTGHSVYNMSWGGYSVVDFVCLFDEVLARRPHTLLVAFYTPDLYPAYHRIYVKGILRRFAEGRTHPLDWLVQRGSLSPPSQRLAEIHAMEPIARRTFERNRRMAADVPYQTPPYRIGLIPAPFDPRQCKLARLLPATNQFFLEAWRPYYRLHYHLTGEVNELVPEPPDNAPNDPSTEPAAIDEDFVATLRKHLDYRYTFTIDRRAAATNLLDPRIAEGFRVVLEAYAEIKERTDREGIRLLAVLIPTKELAFARFLRERVGASFPDEYRSYLARERLVRGLVHDHLVAAGIEVVDVLSRLEHCFAAGLLPYPINQDGHPNPVGYRAMAEGVREALLRPPEANRLAVAFDHEAQFAQAFPASEADRRREDQLRCTAVLEALSPLPTVQSVHPYTRALTVQIYRVDSILDGDENADRIAVASWAIYDSTRVNHALVPGDLVELDLVPFEQEKTLQAEVIDDRTGAFDLPLYYNVSSLPQAPADLATR